MVGSAFRYPMRRSHIRGVAEDAVHEHGGRRLLMFHRKGLVEGLTKCPEARPNAGQSAEATRVAPKAQCTAPTIRAWADEVSGKWREPDPRYASLPLPFKFKRRDHQSLDN